jgi:hypothetical protein
MFWKRAFIVIFAFLAVVGFKLHQKHGVGDDLKIQMISLCGNERECNRRVQLYFADCFEKNYGFGHRFHQAGLDYSQFLVCFKSESGRAYFRVSAD